MGIGGLLLASLLPTAAVAHPLSVSYSRFELKNQALIATIRLPTDDADLLLQLDEDLDGRVSEKEITAASPRIAGYVLRNLMATQSARATSFTLKGAGSWKDEQGQSYVEVTLRGEGVSPDRALDLKVTVLTDLYSSHRNLAEAVTPAGRQTMVFQEGNAWRLEPKRTSGWNTGMAFLKLGVEHIGTGYDHLAFLLGLLLAAPTLAALVGIVTCFTVAHSLTLALATLGVINPPAQAVEVVIALSVAWVGIENVLTQKVRFRWLLAFAFGLIHGFGFAGILREMDLGRSGIALSLFSFNLGVEAGQVVVICLLWPLTRALLRGPYGPQATRYASISIAACGLYWFVDRLV